MSDVDATVMMADYEMILASINNSLLAAGDSNWGNLVYLLAFIIIPILNSVAEWYRKRKEQNDTSVQKTSKIIEPKNRPSRPAPPRRVARPMPMRTDPSASSPLTQKATKHFPKPNPVNQQNQPGQTQRSKTPVQSSTQRQSKQQVNTVSHTIAPIIERAQHQHFEKSNVSDDKTRKPIANRPPPPSATQGKTRSTSRRTTKSKVTQVESRKYKPQTAHPSLEKHHVQTHIEPIQDVADELYDDAYAEIHTPSIEQLRKAVVLSEILTPPLALRENQIGGWS